MNINILQNKAMPHTTKQRKRKEVKLTKIERCLLLLAQRIDRCPYNEYKNEVQILEELGYERKPSHK